MSKPFSPVPENEIRAAALTIDGWKQRGAELLKSKIPETRAMGQKLLDDASSTTPYKLAADVWWTFTKAMRNGPSKPTEAFPPEWAEAAILWRKENGL